MFYFPSSIRFRSIKLLSKSVHRSAVSFRLPQSNNGIGVITMSSQPVNSLSRDMFLRIIESIDMLESDENCHALILTSSCKVFSSGLDLKVFNNPSVTTLVEYWKAFQQVQRKLYNSRLFTLAAINGHAIAGGCILCLCCDERIIMNEAKIGLNETTFGLMPPPFAAALMIDAVGTRKAYNALTLGTMFSAGEALQIGLVDEIYNPSKNANMLSENHNHTSYTGIELDEYCLDYTKTHLRITSSPSSTDTNMRNSSTNTTTNVTTSAEIPGRSSMKSKLRKPLDDHFYGTPSLIQHDVDVFVDMIMNPHTQVRIDRYLASLSAAKNKKI